MKAVKLYEHGGIENLRYESTATPDCIPGKILVQMKAAALNHLDIFVRNGIPGVPLPLIPGSDGSGVVVDVGEGVENWETGDEFVVQPGTFCSGCNACMSGRENLCKQYGILGETENGTMADYMLLDSVNVFPKPAHLSFVEAASMPLAFMTAYQMLIGRGDLRKNEKVLVLAGSSGVGAAAIQIASDLAASVFATASSRRKIEFAHRLGATKVYDHYDDNWVKAAKADVPQGFDMIVEHVGSATWKNSLRLLGRGGRIVSCGATTGGKLEFDMRHIFMKHQSIIGSTMSDIPNFQAMMAKVESGNYQPVVDEVFPLSEIQEAHKRLESSEQIGKVVCEIS